jgi:hypothetical protein
MTKEEWDKVESMYGAIMMAIEQMQDRLDTIESTVDKIEITTDNIEANMPVQEEGK